MECAAEKAESATFSDGLPPAFAAFSASLLTLSASFINFLNHHGYPLLQISTLALLLALTAICACMAAWYSAVGSIYRRILEAILIALLFDINFTGLAASLAIFAISAVALILYKRSIAPMLAVFGSVVLLTTLAGTLMRTEWIEIRNAGVSERKRAPADARPAIVHVILDEHLGFGGFPSTPAGNAMQAEIVDFYLDHDFRIYPRAYSEHLDTINAIPDMLNFGEGQARSAGKDGMIVGPTRTSERLRQLGYNLTIYQSQFADFCSGLPTAHCVEYNQDSLEPTLFLSMNFLDRTGLILAKFVSLSELSTPAKALYFSIYELASVRGLEIPDPIIFEGRSSTVAALKMFDVVGDRLTKMQPGEALFFHALFPHYPMTVGEDCIIKPREQWRLRRDWTSLEQRQTAYHEQIRCANRMVEKIVSAVERSPAANRYAIIIHGDHGSRITRKDPRTNSSSYDRDDLRSSFSTLMAVKIYGNKGGIDNIIIPVSRVLGGFSREEYRRFPRLLAQKNNEVMIPDHKWKPTNKLSLPTYTLEQVSE